MRSYLRNAICLGSLLAAMLLCAGCGKSNSPTSQVPPSTAAATTQPQTEPPKESVEHYEGIMKAGELYLLDSYPNLKSVDLSGSDCYSTILDYMKKHPDIQVTYTVDFGGSVIANDATSATLEAGAYEYELLLENLQYLPNLQVLSLPGITLNTEQMDTLVETYPELSFDYVVTILGQTYTQDVTELDLTALETAQVEEVAPKLGLLTHLTDVELSSSLTIEDVEILQDAAPRITFHYSFTLFGKTISTTDETVEFKNQSIGNEGEADIRRVLPILDNCTRFVLDNCDIDSEVLAGIREDFRDGPKVVWRVYFGVGGRYNALTDTDTIRAVYNVTDETCGPMKYCEDVKYMDIGHNEYLTDLSFVGYMPNIEVLIASGCAAKTLEGFENCKKLTWLELAYCYKLESVEPLAECESLTYLNISYSKVTDYMPLETLPLKRFMCLSPKASTEEQNLFVEIHPKPDCITVFYGYSNPYGYGWRYDDNGKTFNDYYKNVVREAFNYDYLEQFLPKDD